MKFYFNNNCYNKYKTVYDIKERSFYIPQKTGQYVIEFEKTYLCLEISEDNSIIGLSGLCPIKDIQRTSFAFPKHIIVGKISTDIVPDALGIGYTLFGKYELHYCKDNDMFYMGNIDDLNNNFFIQCTDNIYCCLKDDSIVALLVDLRQNRI